MDSRIEVRLTAAAVLPKLTILNNLQGVSTKIIYKIRYLDELL